MFKEQRHQCMKKARTAEARPLTIATTYSIVPESVRAFQGACVQAIALYGCEHWWDRKEVGRRNDLQLHHNQQPRSILVALHTTPQGALMRESALTPPPVILDSGQQHFAARLTDPCSSKLTQLHRSPWSGAPICHIVKEEHEDSGTTEGMIWPAVDHESVDRSTVQDHSTAAKSTAQRWPRLIGAKVGAGAGMWWTGRSCSDNG